MATTKIDTNTGKFLDSEPPVGAAVVVITIPRNPDPTLERYTGNPANPFRPATAQEIADSETVKVDSTAVKVANSDLAIKATVITSLWGRLGKQPTNAEIDAELSRWRDVYKTLLNPPTK